VRRRRHLADEAYTFELVPDDGDEAVPGAFDGLPELATLPAGPGLADGETPVRRRRGPGPRGVVAAGVVALLALGAVGVDAFGDRNRAAALRTASGGVLDLSEPPEVRWSAEADDRGPGGLVAVMGGAAVIQRYEELSGIDLDTGVRRWTVDLPDAVSECGVGYGLWDQRARVLPSRLLVCLSGGGDEPVAIVVDREGGVLSRRTLGVAEEDLVRPAPDGTVITASWVDAYDLRVRLLDAATGEIRWEQPVDLDPSEEAGRCVETAGGGRDGRTEPRGDLSAASSGDLLWVSGCGIDAWFTMSGARLDVGPWTPVPRHGPAVRVLDGGGYVGSSAGGRLGASPEGDRLLAADGALVAELDGHVLVPRASDGVLNGVHLVRNAGATVAVDDAGQVLWTSQLRATVLLAQAGGVGVVGDATARVVGIDLATGRELWEHRDLLAEIDDDVWGSIGNRVQSVFTDGRHAALVWPALDEERVAAHWLALDVATGEIVWAETLDHQAWGIDLAADGRMLRWSPTGISGLG
jgi:outer membrane protein assembly factor BamB